MPSARISRAMLIQYGSLLSSRWPAMASSSLALSTDGSQHDARAEAPGDVQRQRVQAADGVVQRDRSESLDLGHDLVDQRGAVGRADVVRLQHEARHVAGLEAMGELEVVELARQDVRSAVDVGVEGAFEEAFDRLRVSHSDPTVY